MENENKEIKENLEETETIEQEAETIEQELVESEEVTELEVVEEQQETVEQEVEEEYVGKEVTTSIRYDYRTMKYYNMYNAAYRKKLPLLYLVFGLITIGLAVYMLINSFLDAKENPEASMTGTYFTLAIFAFFAFYFIKQAVTFESFVDRQITNHFAMHKVAKQNIRIREDKITLIPIEKPEEAFSYDWAHITSIEEIDEFFFLYIGKQPLIISKDPNNMVEGSYEQMLEIFDEKISVKPYKRCTKKVVKKPITYIHQDDLEADKEAIEVETVETEVTEENND